MSSSKMMPPTWPWTPETSRQSERKIQSWPSMLSSSITKRRSTPLRGKCSVSATTSWSWTKLFCRCWYLQMRRCRGQGKNSGRCTSESTSMIKSWSWLSSSWRRKRTRCDRLRKSTMIIRIRLVNCRGNVSWLKSLWRSLRRQRRRWTRCLRRWIDFL